MEFLGKIGIDFYLLLAQIINFVVLLFILHKLVYKPVLEKIKEQKTELKELEDTKKILVRREEELKKMEKEKLTEIKNKANRIINEAENIAKELKERIEAETLTEKQAVLKQIKSRLKK